MRISNSFSEGEIQVLEFMMNTLLRGGSPTTVTRNKEFASLYRKVMSMKKRVDDRYEARDATTESSVGNVEAHVEGEVSERKVG